MPVDLNNEALCLGGAGGCPDRRTPDRLLGSAERPSGEPTWGCVEASGTVTSDLMEGGRTEGGDPHDSWIEATTPAPQARRTGRTLEPEIDMVPSVENQQSFWRAQVAGQVTGVLSLVRDGMVARMREIHIESAWRHTTAVRGLFAAVLQHCRQQGLLKVVFESSRDHGTDHDIFLRYGFQFSRSRLQGDRHQVEFYLNPYHRLEKRAQPSSQLSPSAWTAA